MAHDLDVIRQAIEELDAAGIEPDLESKIDPAYAATWGMKKAACEYEAREMWAAGRYSLEDNPFTDGTWAHKWWYDEYAKCDA